MTAPTFGPHNNLQLDVCLGPRQRAALIKLWTDYNQHAATHGLQTVTFLQFAEVLFIEALNKKIDWSAPKPE